MASYKNPKMSHSSIQNQIEAIRQATANALKSKESAMKFLVDAGIIKQEKTHTALKTSTHNSIKKKDTLFEGRIQTNCFLLLMLR